MFQIECLVNVAYTLNACVLYCLFFFFSYFCNPLLFFILVFSLIMTSIGAPDLQTIDLHTAKHKTKY